MSTGLQWFALDISSGLLSLYLSIPPLGILVTFSCSLDPHGYCASLRNPSASLPLLSEFLVLNGLSRVYIVRM